LLAVRPHQSRQPRLSRDHLLCDRDELGLLLIEQALARERHLLVFVFRAARDQLARAVEQKRASGKTAFELGHQVGELVDGDVDGAMPCISAFPNASST